MTLHNTSGSHWVNSVSDSPIEFISAKDGMVELYTRGFDYDKFGGKHLLAASDNPRALADAMKFAGLAERVMGSSSMDFASEEGFSSNAGALDLWDEAVGIYNWEVNGVAS